MIAAFRLALVLVSVIGCVVLASFAWYYMLGHQYGQGFAAGVGAMLCGASAAVAERIRS